MQYAAQAAQPAVASRAKPSADIRFHSGEEEVLRVNLSDLDLPKVHNLEVDGLKPSWFARLFGRR